MPFWQSQSPQGAGRGWESSAPHTDGAEISLPAAPGRYLSPLTAFPQLNLLSEIPETGEHHGPPQIALLTCVASQIEQNLNQWSPLSMQQQQN